MSVDCIVADDNPLLDFISIKNLNLIYWLFFFAKIFILISVICFLT